MPPIKGDTPDREWLGEGSRDHVFYFGQMASEMLGRVCGVALCLLHPGLQTNRNRREMLLPCPSPPVRLLPHRSHTLSFAVTHLRAES